MHSCVSTDTVGSEGYSPGYRRHSRAKFRLLLSGTLRTRQQKMVGLVLNRTLRGFWNKKVRFAKSKDKINGYGARELCSQVGSPVLFRR